MQKLFYILIPLIFFLAGCKTQKEFSQKEESKRLESIDFPKDWRGKWKGDLMIYSGLGLQYQIIMELYIEPIPETDNHSFTIIYDSDKGIDKRNYELITVDKDQGLFLVDEKNTILIESYFIAGKWFQRFEVLDNMLYCTIEEMGDQLVWEITSGQSTPISTTGDTTLVDIFEVNTYPIGVYQRAVLSRYQ